MFEISMIDEKQRSALGGIYIDNNGKCTIICRVEISIHSFFRDIPRMIERKMLKDMTPVIDPFVILANV